MGELRPWTLTASQVEIVDSYEAEIIADIIEEDGKQHYAITFADTDGGMVEAELAKESFNTFPHPVKAGTYFGIVLFRLLAMPGVVCAGAWPVAKYWSQSLRAKKLGC